MAAARRCAAICSTGGEGSPSTERSCWTALPSRVAEDVQRSSNVLDAAESTMHYQTLARERLRLLGLTAQRGDRPEHLTRGGNAPLVVQPSNVARDSPIEASATSY